MNILRKIIIFLFVTTTLLSGCRTMMPGNKPLPPSVKEVSHTEELAPPAKENAEGLANASQSAILTSAPDPISEHKTSLAPGKQSIKPRLSYTVNGGELLWSIAKRPDVYGDPLLWPLLYQANRDQIRDPRKIYAGQILSIPRNCSEAEQEDARNRAKKSDFFSPE